MAECGNMPDWHPYNAPPGGRAAPPSGSQSASAGHMFISSLTPPALDSVNLTADRHQTSKHQSEPTYGRNYVGAQNPGGTCSTSTSLPSGVHMTPLPGCVSHYAGSSSTRNPMMDGLAGSMDPRMVQVAGLSDEVAHRNGQMSFPGPPHPSSANVNVNAGPAGMQNSPVGPMSPGRQPGYGACKAPCCHPDTAMAYQHWDKYGHYHGPPSAPSSYRENIRQSSYPPVDQRRYMPEMNIRKDCIDKDLVEPAGFPVEHRRNYEYKYPRKEPVVPRNYPPAGNGMLQNYPMQNYNCANDHQKCPYSVKDYMRRGSSGGSVAAKSSAMLKYQEQQQSVIVQQKYPHAKQMQYQNGPAGVVMPSTSSSANLPSSLQNSYYNATQIPRDLSRDYPRDYSQEQAANRMSQAPPSSHVHGSFSKYQAYHQKIAMQRYSMENHLRSYSRIPGYQSHPKYQECVMRYRELLRLQQTVDYQSVLQEAPKVPSPTNAVPPVAPINLQFDQNGVLINSNYIPGNYPGIHGGMNPASHTESADPAANVRMSGSGPSMDQRGQFVDHGDQSMNLTRDVDHQSHQGAVMPMHESAEHYYMPAGKSSHAASYEVGRLGSTGESLNTLNVDVAETTKKTDEIATSATTTTVAPSMPIVSTTSSMDYKNSKDFADKPELDVRQFLATWDESEDEDAAAASVIATSLAERFDDQVFPSKSPTIGTTPNDATSAARERNSQDEKDNPSAATSASGASPLTDSTSEIDIGTNENSPINNAESVTITNEIQCIRTDDGDEIPTIHIVDNLEAGTDLEKIHTVFGSLASSVLNPISIGEASSELVGEAGKSETIVLFEQENGVCTKTLEFSVSSEAAGSEVVEGVIASIIESSTVETPQHQQSTETPTNSPYDPPQEATDSPTDRLLPVQEGVPTTTSSASTTSTTSSSSSSKTNETVETTILRKQNSFTSDESHNPDDISLPDLQTSECTPISTTLNTPIHSDSEESSEHVSDLTTSTNPIEIIQNSPIISFTHSPIKIEPYEQLEARMGRSTRQRAAVEQLERHDSLDFDFDREVAAGENTKYTEASETSDTGGVEGLEPEVSRTEESMLLADIQEHPEKNSYSEKSVVETVTDTEFYRTADPLVGMAHISKSASEDRGDDVEEPRPTESQNDDNDETNRDSPVDRILDNDELDTSKCPTMMESEDDFNRSSDLEKLCDMSLDASCMMPLISGEDCDEPRIPVAPIEDGDCFAKMMNDALPPVDLDACDSSSDERLGKPDEDMWGDVRYVDKHLDANFASTNDQRGKNEAERSKKIAKAAKASSRSVKSSPTRTKHHGDRMIDETSQNEVERRIDLSESEDEESHETPDMSGETIASKNDRRDKSCPISSTEQQKSSSRERKFEESPGEESRRNRERKFEESPGEESRRNRDLSKRRSSRDTKDSEENSREDNLKDFQREKSCISPAIEQQKSSSRERKFDDCAGQESRKNRDLSKRTSSRETKDFEENSRIDDSDNCQRENNCASPSIEQQKLSSRERKFEDCTREETRRNRDSLKRRLSREATDFEENSRMEDFENSHREKSCASPSIEQQKSSSREQKLEDCPVEESRRNKNSLKRRSSRDMNDSEENSRVVESENSQREDDCASPSIELQKSSNRERKFDDCPSEESRRIRDSSKRRSSREAKDFEENSRSDDSENFQREKSCASPSVEQQKSSFREQKSEDCPGEESRRNRDSTKRRLSRETKDFEEHSRTVDSDEETKNPLTKSYTTKHRDSNVEIQVANFNVKIHDNEVIRNETVGPKTKSLESSDDGLDAIEIKINVSRGDVNRRSSKQLQEKFIEEDRRVTQESDVPESSPQPRETIACASAKKRCRRRRRSMPDGYEPKKSKRTEDDRLEANDYYTPKKITRGRNGRHKVRRSMDDELLFKPDRSRKDTGTTEERNFHLEMAKAFNLPWPRDETPETCDSSSSLLTKEDKDYLDSRNEKKSSTKSKLESRSDKHVKETRTLPSPSYNSTENSSTLDFDNFDVAPHHSSDTDPDKLDSSSETRYARVKRTRLEDRDRYRNPSSYGTSFDELSSLDAFEINLNTVPIYTTKDGRVTYSPNRNYTYRALIMEARQREGYPALRKLHYPRHLSSRGHYRETALRKIYKRRQDERSAHEKKRRSGEYHAGKFKRPASTRHHQDEGEPRLAMRPKKHDNRRRETRLPSEMSECCSDDQSRDYVEDGATSKNRSVDSLVPYHNELQGHPKTTIPQREESSGTRRSEIVRKDDQSDISRNNVSSFTPGAGPKNVLEEKLRSPKHHPSRDENSLVSKIFQGQELEISARKVSSTVGQERAKNEREACVRTSRFFQDSPSSTKTPMASPLINLEKRPIGWDLEQDCQTVLSDSGLESSTTYVEASKESRRIQRWKNSFVNKVEITKTIYNTPIDDYTEAIDLSREKLPVEENRRYFEDEKNDLPIEDNENSALHLEIGSEKVNVVEAGSLEVEEPKNNAEKIEGPVETERRRINVESALPIEPLDEDALKNDRMSEIVKSLDLAITHRHRPSLKEPKIGLEREISKPIGAADNRDAAKPAASIFHRDREAMSFTLRKASEAPSRRASSDGVESRDSRSEFFRGPIVSEISNLKIVREEIDETEFFVERIVDESENNDSQTATSEVAGRAPSPENFQASCKDFLIDTSTSFSSCMKLPALVSALPTESESSRLEDTSTRFASESMDFKDESDSLRSEFMPFTSHGTIDSSAMDNDTSGRDSFFCSIAENATNPSADCTIGRSSVDSLERYATSDCRSKESSPAAPILSFSGQIQSDSRNSDSLTKSPPNLSCEDSVSKIVLKNRERESQSPVCQPIETSTNSSICQPTETSMNLSASQPIEISMNSSISQPIETSMTSSISQPIEASMNSSTNDSVKSEEPIEQETSYPKIPKMIIRNLRSRPGSPSAVEENETEDTKAFTREQRVFEVEIKLEKDTIERESPAECKVPKMKIKLEDKQQPRMILEAPKPASLEAVEQTKNVPKVKIRKIRRSSKSRSPIRVGKLSRQSSENEIPVEAPDNAENSNASGSYKFTLVDKSSSKSHQSGRTERVEEDSRHNRIPKLTIKKQEVVGISSGYSSSQLKKRRSRSPGESGSKKQRRSTGKHGKKEETRSRERRNNSSDSNEGNTDSQSPSEKIPKVIIKRTSPSAEFKCELSKVGREAITKDSKWQPEVKLQRSWVLDCMAKEPGGGKLALKMLETSSESGLKRKSDGSSRRNGEWKRSTSDSTSRKTSQSVESKARRRSDCELSETQARYSDEQRPRTLLVGNCRSKSFDDNINAKRGVSPEEVDCSSAISEARPSRNKVKSNRTLKILNDEDFEYTGNDEKDEAPDERQDRSEADSRKSKKSAKNGASFEEPESSVIKLDSSDESQTTIEILPASPLDSQPESLDTIEPSSEVEQSIGNGAMGKLYSDEAIPTQFELELDIVDNSTMDSLDVPVPMPGESNLEEDSAGERANRSEPYKPYRSSDDENAATEIGFDKFVYDADTKSVSLKKSRRSTDNDRRNICCSDSLVKEVLAAKETLKRCLTKSKSAVVRTKMKPRTKTAAEKKQGAGFDFVGLAAYAKTSKCDVEERAVFQDTVKGTKNSEANGCRSDGKARSEREENFCGTDRGDPKREKTRESSGKDRHRKSNWSSEGRPSGRSRDEHVASGTSSKVSKHTEQVGSTKTKGGRTVEHEIGENSRSKSSSEKSSTNRSFETDEKSADRLGSGSKSTNTEDHVKKIKSYKIPKISRSRDKNGEEEAAAAGEEKRKSPSPAKMPVLEPQVDLNFELAVSDRDTSRSPPVITKQEDRRADSDLPKTIEDNVSLDKLDSITKQRDSEVVTFADIVSQLAYHEKATIRHRRYCNLCERWFPSTIRHERHLSGYQHRHTELTQRRTVHALFMLFTGKPCPRLLPASIVRTDCLPGEPTPLQIAVQDVAISLEDGASVKPNNDVSSRDE